MTGQEMWAAYIRENPAYRGAPYEAWQYGSDAPDTLAALTLAGTKTATASAYEVYRYEKSPLPAVGGHSVILNTADEAVCIIQTTSVAVVPFCEVSPRHAYLEGEGDRSLRFWREVHAHFFTMELAEIGAVFSDRTPVVCEEFAVVYPAARE